MAIKPFLDTNVLIYAFTNSGLRKVRALELLAAGGIVSVQVLNEFVDVSRRKLKRDWPNIRDALQRLSALLGEPVPLTAATHEEALDIAARTDFRIYDSLLVSAARQAGCTILYSEGMQHGRTIDGVTITNPFLAA